MNLRALHRVLGAVFFAVSLTVSLNLVFSPHVSAEDTLSSADKDFCTQMSAYRLKFDESPNEPGTKDGDLYRLGSNSSMTVRRCLAAKFCTTTEDNPALGNKITCETNESTGEPAGSGDFPNPPANIPTGVKPLLELVCSSYSGAMKQDCRGVVAAVYINSCYTTKEKADKIDEWANCVYKSLASDWILFKKTYPNAKSVPPEVKIKEALQQGMTDTEVAINKASKAKCLEEGGAWDQKSGICTLKDAGANSCAIDGIGWIICPVMNFLAEVNEKAFGFLQSLLGVRPSLIQDKGTVEAWSKFRDFANVAFIIAFMVIIYSQITSVGISNYGIKKLLPKIAIAAIMVNLSLFACQILVDVSNIAGSSLYSFISGLVEPLKGTEFNQDSAWSSLMGGVLIAGVGVLLVAIVVVAPTVLLALGLILLILVARQAFILILIIISPLAFVAYLLPNTESMFKKWWKALTATLLVYPIIAVVFGASTLASNILMGIASEKGNVGVDSMNDDSQMLAIVALAVMAVPLFAVPVILKSAMSGAGAIGAKLANLQDRANRRAGGDIKDRAGKEFKSVRDSLGSRMLTSSSRRARTAAFLTGTRRRARREAKYKDNDAIRTAAEETFTHTDQKSAARKARVVGAQETANLNKEIVQNQAKLGHLNNNHDLHGRATSTGLDLHNAEETHKNQVGAAHMANPDNYGQYNALNASRGVKQNAELETTRRFESSAVGQALGTERLGLEDQVATAKSDQKVAYNAQQAALPIEQSIVQQRKAAEGQAKLGEQTSELRYQNSADGQAREQRLKQIEGELNIAQGEQSVAFKESDSGVDIALRQDSIKQQEAAADASAETIAIATNRPERLEAQAAKDSLAAAQAGEDALVQELRTDEGGAAHPAYAGVAQELQSADISKRVQSQRGTNAQKKANVEYAQKVGKDVANPTQLAIDSAGIAGSAGVSQAQAVAFQTMVKAYSEGVAAEKTLLSQTENKDLLERMDQPDFLEQPEELVSAVAGTIADRQHQESHIKLWSKMGEMSKQANAELEAAKKAGDTAGMDRAAVKIDKIKNMQQQVMGDKKKIPFGVGDRDMGDAGIGTYSGDIYESTRERISTHMAPQKLSQMDPDDLRLVFEMAREGKLSDTQIKKVADAYTEWEKDPILKSSLQDKQRKFLDPIRQHATTGTPTYPPDTDGPFKSAYSEVKTMSAP